jgi:hypothetical protein
MKSGSNFQEAGDPAIDFYHASRGNGDSAQDLKERALSGTIAAYDSDDLSLRDLEGDVFQRPKIHLF